MFIDLDKTSITRGKEKDNHTFGFDVLKQAGCLTPGKFWCKKDGHPLDDRFPNIEVTRFELAASTSRT